MCQCGFRCESMANLESHTVPTPCDECQEVFQCLNATNQHKTVKHINTTQEMPRMDPVKRPKTPDQEAYMPEIKEEMDVEQFNQGFESSPNQSYNCDCVKTAEAQAKNLHL